MTPVIYSLLSVVLLCLTVNAVSARSASASTTYYYEPIVPYGPYPAPGYVLSTYLPNYARYRVVTPVRYPPRKTDYEEDHYEQQEEPKYYYGGKFEGVCSIDGLYYKDEMSYVVCSNRYASIQPCPPGTKTDKFPSYKAGYYYGSSDLCSVNLVDLGYVPIPRVNHQQNSYEEKPVTSYGSEKPRKDVTHHHSGSSYDVHEDPYPPNYDSTYHPGPSYPQPPNQPPSYPVDKPSYSPSGGESYHSPTDSGSYPPKKDVIYPPPTDYLHSPSSHPAHSHDTHHTGHYYPPPSTHPRPTDYKRETAASYSDAKIHYIYQPKHSENADQKH